MSDVLLAAAIVFAALLLAPAELQPRHGGYRPRRSGHRPGPGKSPSVGSGGAHPPRT